MNPMELNVVARALGAPGKGILAADESMPTITKRFKALDIPCTEETRRSYRETLLATPGLADFISGVILFDETIRQKTREGTLFVEVIRREGIIPGIKVDKGTKPLANFPDEKITEGLDGLRERLTEYRNLGARFTKWRAVITIGEKIPTLGCLRANAHALARFAALSQEAGLVPIVEPEVLMDGNHTIEQCDSATELTLKIVFDELTLQRVGLEQMVLKASMVISGKTCRRQANAQEVAERTLRCLSRTVPVAVPSIFFLSGGQSDAQATENLNAMNKMGGVSSWQLSFSFGRALQMPALKAWKGSDQNIELAQQALFNRAKLNGLARYGHYFPEMEKEIEPAGV